jgi:hypothetical protein
MKWCPPLGDEMVSPPLICKFKKTPVVDNHFLWITQPLALTEKQREIKIVTAQVARKNIAFPAVKNG